MAHLKKKRKLNNLRQKHKSYTPIRWIKLGNLWQSFNPSKYLSRNSDWFASNVKFFID